MSHFIRIATRTSRLARAQAQLVQDFLMPHFPGFHAEIEPIETMVDKDEELSLEQAGGEGLFTKELEKALLDKEVTIAAHSAKDMPSTLPEGLVIAGYLPREEVEDLFVLRKSVEMPAFIATGSPRRREQAKALYPDAQWIDIRGNVPTRLRKIFDGYAHATFLAAAGLNRLGIDKYTGLVFKRIPIHQMVPAAGQGAIAIECRAGDEERFRPFLDEPTYNAVTIERMVLRLMGAGCQTPVGVHFDGEILHFFHPGKGYHSLILSDLPETIMGNENELAPVLESVLKKLSIETIRIDDNTSTASTLSN